MTRPAKRQKVERRPTVEWESADAMLWDPQALVGQELRVLWPDDNRYFPGRVTQYSPATFQHEVQYEDGDEEKLVLATEKVQLTPACARAIVPPSPAHLAALARHLDELADKLEVKAVQQRTARGRTKLKEEDRQQLELLRRRAAEVRAARERREQMLQQEQECQEEAKQQCAAAPRRVATATGRARHAGELSTGLASAAACQCSPRRRHNPASGDSEAASPRAVHDSSQPGLMQPTQGQEQQTGSGGLPFRVCSPASAKRRQQLLRQQQELLEGQSSDVVHVCQASGSVVPGQSPFGYPLSSGATAKQQAPMGRPAVPRAGVTGWGVGPRNSRAQGAAADGDLGRLYVPRAWPTVRIASGASTAGPEAVEAVIADPVAAEGGAKEALQTGSAAATGQGADGTRKQAGSAGVDGEGKSAGGSGRSSDAEKRRAAATATELREAYQHFRRHCSSFKQYHEVQVVLWLSGQQLVGREVRVLWPDEEAWFCGRVTRYDEEAGTHTVEYDDGDVEHLHLAAEEVRLQVVPGEAEAGLLPQPPAALQRTAACIAADAERLRKRAAELQRAQAKLPRPRGQEQGHDEDPVELTAKADRWAARAAQLQALAAVMLREVESANASSDRQQRQGVMQVPAADAQGMPQAVQGACATQPGATPSGPAAADNAAITAPLTPPCNAASDAPSAASDGDLGAMAGDGQPPGVIASALDSAMAEAGDADGASALEPRSTGATAATAVAEPSLPADWEIAQVLRPGEVVWAQVKRSAPWPAIIIPREEAEREGLSAARMSSSASTSQQMVCVRFFGDHTVYALHAVSAGQRIPDRGGVLPFLAGLELGWHFRRGTQAATATGASCSNVHLQRFQRALFELRTYMTEGELPRGMIPPNYDEDDDEEVEDGGAGAPAVTAASTGRKASGARGAANIVATPSAPVGDLAFPFAVGPKLQVLALGEVVWLSRWFHDEKYIYPVGYTAARLMASGASGGREVRHVMEVLASEDGVRPVFRITPEGRPPVSADTATRAMRALFEDDVLARGRAFAKTGADLFGLSNQRVAALVRALPDTDRCERFANWPDQDKPPLPPLTPYEEVQRRALYARSLRLPPGVTPVPHTKTGMCFECEVCGQDEESADDLKLECDMCRCVVHSRCYGVKQPPHGALWLCDVCQLHAAGLPADRAPPCELCPVAGGPMKRTEEGGYVHLLCAVWTPGVTLGDPDTMEPVGGVPKAVQNRSSLRCFLCKQPHGACIQCSGGPRCYTAFHPMCAREAGLAMCEVRQGAKENRSGGAGRAEAPAGAAAARSAPVERGAVSQPGAEEGPQEGRASVAVKAEGTVVAEPMQEDEEKENRQADSKAGDSDVAAVLDAVGGDAVVLIKSTPPPSVSKAGAQDAGTNLKRGANPTVALPNAPAISAAVAPAAQRRGRGRSRGGASRGAALAASLSSGACRGGVTLGNGTSLVCICPRHEELVLHAMHFRTSYPGGRFAERRAELIREQLRARREQLLVEAERDQPPPPAAQQQPESNVAAVRSGPLACGGQAMSGSARAASFLDWRSRGHRAPEAVAIAREKRTFVRQLPYLVTGRMQQDERAVQAVPCCSVRLGEQHGQGAPTAPSGAADGLRTGPSDAGVAGGSVLPEPLVEAAAAAGARSVAERYAEMRATVGRRLAAGKSAIHGWGAFAKVPHKRGDMLIEYAGELIRPVVSDVREKRMYDKLVGCGTYIFNLNEQQHIDATRAGNMAHLLNHSCDPNCYSRAITLWNPATGTSTDHVIITAKRDIKSWEELTYDYRFNSSVELPCNCGAAKCRLLVNWPEQPRDEDDADDEEEEDGEDAGGAGSGGDPEPGCAA